MDIILKKNIDVKNLRIENFHDLRTDKVECTTKELSILKDSSD